MKEEVNILKTNIEEKKHQRNALKENKQHLSNQESIKPI